MIPVLIAPAYNRHDLLERMLWSVDAPVGKLLIVDNNRDYSPTVTWPNATIFRPPFQSLGYGGSINFGISQNPAAPWWMWASNDVQFHKGHLATVIERMNQTTEPRIVTGGFTWGAVNRALVDTVGLVDEWSFWPIYFDDNDYQYRCKLAGVEWIEDWSDGSTHGDGVHSASVTINADQRTRESNDRSFVQNGQAYREKWGGWPHHERYQTPWDSGMPVWVTRPDIAGRHSRRWR